MHVLEQALAAKDRLVKQKDELKNQLLTHWASFEHLFQREAAENDAANKPVLYPVFKKLEMPSFLQRPPVVSSNDANAVDHYEEGEWFHVNQDLINQFASVTNDTQWIHTDPERAAKESPYRSTVAHGFLLLSLLPHLMPERDWAAILGSEPKLVINTGLEHVRFSSPLKANSDIRLVVKSISTTSLRRGFQVSQSIILEARNGKVVAEAVVLYRVVSHNTNLQPKEKSH